MTLEQYDVISVAIAKRKIDDRLIALGDLLIAHPQYKKAISKVTQGLARKRRSLTLD